MMPGMDGFTLLKKIKSHHALSSIPIFILTGKAFPPDTKKALSMGADRFLTKPITSKILLEEIRSGIKEVS
jgi:CheY-like chemotaxis protein